MAKSAKELAQLVESTWAETTLEKAEVIKLVQISEELKLKERAIERMDNFLENIRLLGLKIR